MVVSRIGSLTGLLVVPSVVFVLLTGCASPNRYAPQPRAIGYEEASAFERSLLDRGAVPIPDRPVTLYVQPLNKKEDCKLPTTQAQLDRQDFRAYWDGQCKNGFAFGLGRDIAISDTHHYDAVTIHDGSGSNFSSPTVIYDYVNSRIQYRMGASKFPAGTMLEEHYDNPISGFNINTTLKVRDELGNEFHLYMSPFNPLRRFVNQSRNGPIAFRFDDRSAAPVTNPKAAVFVAEILDPRSMTVGGVAFVRFANGNVGHFKVGSGTNEPITIPTAYTDHMRSKYQEISNAISRAHTSIERVKQVEREYLFKACNGKSGIRGLDSAIYTKICTWRDQFREPHAIASDKYQKQLASMKQQAVAVEHQIAQQRQMLQQQQEQQAWKETNQMLETIGLLGQVWSTYKSK